MKITKLFSFLFAATATMFISTSCGDSVEKASDAKEDFYIFVLAGDEQMAGRAEESMEDFSYDSHIFVYDKSGNWVPAKQPLYKEFDSDAKQGQGLWFARGFVMLNKKLKIGLVPCIVPNSLIADWQPGKKNFDDMVERAKKASSDGVLKGILWFHGEHETSTSAYKESFPKMLKGVREKIGKNVPFLTTQLAMNPLSAAQRAINTYLMDYALSNADKYFYCISNQGLSVGSDGKHFNLNNVMVLDDRFFSGYSSMGGITPPEPGNE